MIVYLSSYNLIRFKAYLGLSLKVSFSILSKIYEKSVHCRVLKLDKSNSIKFEQL